MSERFLLSSKLPPYVFNITNELKAARNPRNHRYSVSRGIPHLREAIAARYLRKWGVQLDPGSEVVQTIGAKEGLAHLVMTVLAPGETAVVPVPAYPIHTHSVIIANGRLVKLPAESPADLLDRLAEALRDEPVLNVCTTRI